MLATRLDVIYEYADLQAAIAALSGVVEVTIPLSEVERAAADPPPAARFELMFDSAASAEIGALASLSGHPFRLSCDDQELFVGVIYPRGGAAAIETPVLHIETSEDGSPVLWLGARQGAWIPVGTGNQELRERIDRAELRAGFCARGILGELQ